MTLLTFKTAFAAVVDDIPKKSAKTRMSMESRRSTENGTGKPTRHGKQEESKERKRKGRDRSAVKGGYETKKM